MKRGVLRSEARVLLVGIGGLGSPAAIVLADAGIGTIGIADDDDVELSNLHRQILFDEADVGTKKTAAARRALEARARPCVDQAAQQTCRQVSVVTHDTRLLPHNAVSIVSGYDVVLEGSDNFATKFMTADACFIAKVAVVHAAAVRWHGTALAVSAHGTPCYRCLFEDLPTGGAPNCADAGVVGPMVGVVGALAADLALGFIDGRDVAGTLVTFDGKTDRVRRRPVDARKGCALCGDPLRIASIEASRYTVEA